MELAANGCSWLNHSPPLAPNLFVSVPPCLCESPVFGFPNWYADILACNLFKILEEFHDANDWPFLLRGHSVDGADRI